MNVTCPSCQTRFRLAPDRIAPAGARVRCSACKGVFRLSPSGEVSPDAPVEAAPALAAAASRAGNAPAGAHGQGFPATDPFAPPPLASATERAAEALRAMVAAFPPREPAHGGDRSSRWQAAQPRHEMSSGAFGASAAGGELSPRTPPIASVDSSEQRHQTTAPLPALEPDGLALEETTPPVRASPPPLAHRSATPDAGSAPLGAAAAPSPVPVEDDFSLTPTPAPAAAALPPARAPVARPPADAEVQATSSLPKLRRPGFAAIAANALSLALLLALTAGLLAWRGGLGRRVRGVAPTGAAVATSAVRAGLYDTSDGTTVLIVRGEVRAERGVTGPVRVHVALVDGARTVATADALAGASATPEEVYAASTSAEAAALRRALDGRAALALPAGGAAPFVAIFPPPLPDLSALEVRTAAEPARGP